MESSYATAILRDASGKCIMGYYSILLWSAVMRLTHIAWNAHIEYVITKAAKRLYVLRLLKWTGVMPEDMLKIYTYIRSALEYAAQVSMARYSCIPF